MRVIILLAAVAWSNCAKLDNTYLPPSSAQTSGGSGNFLQTPLSGPNEYQRNAQSRGPARFFQDSQNYPQNFPQTPQSGFAQNRPINNFAQTQNNYQGQKPNYFEGNDDFAQSNSGFAPNGNVFTPRGNDIAQDEEYSNNAGDFEFNSDGRPERAQTAFERNAGILRQDSQNDGETYSYAYETENGISAEESGVATNGVEAQGGFSYTGDDGRVYSIRYTADQNGFVPIGDHLPTPPPIPEEILRALEQNARDEAAGIYDDGSYNEAKYGSANANDQYNSNKYENANNFDNNNSNNYGNDDFSNNNLGNDNVGTNFDNNFASPSDGNNNLGNDNVGTNFDNNFASPSDGNDEDSVVTNNALLRSNQPGFRNQGFDNQNYRNQELNEPGFNQGNRNNQQDFGSQAGVTTAYLPPANQRSRNQGQISGPAFNQGGFINSQDFRNQRNGASNAYLPPTNQRSRQNGFGRRQPASGRNGYQY